MQVDTFLASLSLGTTRRDADLEDAIADKLHAVYHDHATLQHKLNQWYAQCPRNLNHAWCLTCCQHAMLPKGIDVHDDSSCISKHTAVVLFLDVYHSSMPLSEDPNSSMQGRRCKRAAGSD